MKHQEMCTMYRFISKNILPLQRGRSISLRSLPSIQLLLFLGSPGIWINAMINLISELMLICMTSKNAIIPKCKDKHPLKGLTMCCGAAKPFWRMCWLSSSPWNTVDFSMIN